MTARPAMLRNNFVAGALVNPTQADNLVPTGTLRAAFIATNPVQATVDPSTGEVHGPANDLGRELGRRLGVPVNVTPAMGNKALLEVAEKFLDEARNSRFIASAIEHAGLVSVDVACKFLDEGQKGRET